MQIIDTDLVIPLQPGDDIRADYGVVDIEPFSQASDSLDASLFRSIAFEHRNNQLHIGLRLPPGEYLAHIHQPRGPRITKLISIATDEGAATAQFESAQWTADTESIVQAPPTYYRAAPALFAIHHHALSGNIEHADGQGSRQFAAFDGATDSGHLPSSGQGDAHNLASAAGESSRSSMREAAADRPLVARVVSGTSAPGATGGRAPHGPIQPYRPDTPSGGLDSHSNALQENDVTVLAGAAPGARPDALLQALAGDSVLSAPALFGYFGLGSASPTFTLPVPATGAWNVPVVEDLMASGPFLARYVLARLVYTAHDLPPKPARASMLARLPGPWRDTSTKRLSQVFVDASMDGGTARFHIRIADARLQAILDFTQQSDLRSALSLVQPALDTLLNRQVNPYAAAAAAYLILAAPPESLPPAFYDAFCNSIAHLGRDAADLPDGLLLHATLLLQSASLAGRAAPGTRDFPAAPAQRAALATELLLDSLRRGLPLYRAGFKLLVSNLRILQNEGLPDVARLPVNAALALVNQLRMRLHLDEPFTVIDMRGVS